MALHPVGPLPASTYWRRRGVLLLGLLVLLLLLRSCGGDAPPKRTSATPTPTPVVTRSSAPKTTTAPSTRPTVAAPAVCADSALDLSTTTDADAYPVGATPRITLVVTNIGKVPCRRDIGSGAVELQVVSGADRVWSSDDCNPAKAVSAVTLAPAGTQAIVKTWAGTRSAPGCGGTKAQAKGGTYRVVARVGSLRVQGAVFRLQG